MILERISSSADVKRLTKEECRALANELRSTLLNTVSKNGGHLASNLGVVELTIESLRRDDEILQHAERGNWATFPCPRVRVGDKVFFMESV